MSISNKQLRLILRYTHLAAGILIGLFVYSPLGDVPAFELLLQIALIPVAVLSGFWIWQQARVRRLIRQSPDGPTKRNEEANVVTSVHLPIGVAVVSKWLSTEPPREEHP